jgi:disease resistance protein RPM1
MLHRYNFDANTPTKKTTVDPRITALYTDVTELVGIDEAKKEVITRLREGGVDQQQESIISIAGFGGLGKTTLAKSVFDEIKGQFDCKAFVSVSSNPDINKLLKGILFELHNGGDGNNFPGSNLDGTTQLIDLIRKFLQNKRYVHGFHQVMCVFHVYILLSCGTCSLYMPTYIFS